MDGVSCDEEELVGCLSSRNRGLDDLCDCSLYSTSLVLFCFVIRPVHIRMVRIRMVRVGMVFSEDLKKLKDSFGN